MRTPPKFTVRTVKFFNWTDKPFIGKWDSIDYPFKPGDVVMMEDWKAAHFAKHLTDQVLNNLGLPTNHQSRKNYEPKCFIEAQDSIVATNPAELSMLETALLTPETRTSAEIEKVEKKELQAENKMNVPFCDQCASKGVRHLKTCPKAKKTV